MRDRCDHVPCCLGDTCAICFYEDCPTCGKKYRDCTCEDNDQ